MKSKRKVLLGVVLIAAAVWGVLPSLAHFFVQEQIISLQQRGIKLRVDGLAGRRIGVEAEAVEGWIGVPLRGSQVALPVSVRIDRPEAMLYLPLTSPWSPAVRVQGEVYGGSLQVSLGDVLSGGTLRGSLRGVDLPRHPQVMALGLESGVLDVQMQGHPLEGLPVNEAKYEILVKNASLVVPGILRSYLKIDSVSDAELQAKGSLLATGRFSVSSCTFKSSLGRADLKATGSLVGSRLRELSGTVTFDLNTTQGAQLRPWLGLLVPSADLGASEGPILCNFQQQAGCRAGGPIQLNLGAGACLRLECSPGE